MLFKQAGFSPTSSVLYFPTTDSLNLERQRRLQRIRVYWQFYLCEHWPPRSTSGEGSQVPPSEQPLSINYCRRIVDKGATWLYGGGYELVGHEDYEELIGHLNYVWDNNNKDYWAHHSAIMGGVSGDCFVKVTWEPKWNSDCPIRVILLDSAIVEPVFNPHDMDDLQAMIIAYPFLTDEGEIKHYREEITTDTIKIFINDELERSEPNLLGFINVVHWQNLPLPSDYWGVSDLADVIPLNRELNKKSTDISDIIEYHAEPITCVFGARMGSIIQGANRVWSGFPKDAKVSNVQLDGDLTASNMYWGKIKTSMHEVSSVPSGSMDTMSGLSNTSGVGLHIQFLPLIEKTKTKQLTYGKGMREVNEMILKIADIYDLETDKGVVSLDKFGRKKFHIDMIFEMPLPKDRLIELQLIEQEMRLGLESRRGAMERLKRRDIDKKLAEIDKEQEETQRKIQVGLISSDNDPTQKEPANIGGVVRDTDTPAGTAREVINNT